MFSDHSDVWVGIGAVLSSILSGYAWLHSIGLLPLFTFIAGACFTLWTQERLEKKRGKREFGKKMTEHVYGPLHQALNLLLRDLRAFQSPTGQLHTLRTIMQNYRYGLVQKELRHRLEEFEKRLQPYAALLFGARRETEVYIARGLGGHEIDKEVVFQIWFAQPTLSIPIIDPIFNNKTPLDFLTEKTVGYSEFSIIVYVGGKSEGRFSSEHKIHQISKEILEEVGKDPKVREQRKERELLLKECNLLIESIRKEIVLS